jgi:predicted ArsR family transcriptional regulator
MVKINEYDVAYFFRSTKKFQSILPMLKLLSNKTKTTDIPIQIALSYRQVMRDLKELEINEYITVRGETKSKHGRPCFVWQLTEKGTKFKEILLSVANYNQTVGEKK